MGSPEPKLLSVPLVQGDCRPRGVSVSLQRPTRSTDQLGLGLLTPHLLYTDALKLQDKGIQWGQRPFFLQWLWGNLLLSTKGNQRRKGRASAWAAHGETLAAQS